jgi:hypothetical protein
MMIAAAVAVEDYKSVQVFTIVGKGSGWKVGFKKKKLESGNPGAGESFGNNP